MGTWNPGPGPTSGNDTFRNDPTVGENVDAGDGNDVFIISGKYTGNIFLGGAGDDTFYVSFNGSGNGGDGLNGGVLNGGAGFDTVDYSGVQLTSNTVPTRGINVDVIRGSGESLRGVEVVIGSPLDDVIIGFVRMYGGAGNDYLDTQSAIASAEASQAFGGAGNDRMIASDNGRPGATLDGGDGDDVLIAETVATLIGGAGNDQLSTSYGIAGVSAKMFGGAGNDTYTVYETVSVITEYANEGTDEVITSLSSYTLGANIENLTFIQAPSSATTQFRGTGNDLDNVIKGGAYADTLIGAGGNDTLYGGAGDTLIGGAGDDTYIVGAGGIGGAIISEAANEGIDTVRTSASSYTLDANVENLSYFGSGFSFFGTGNALDNTLTGTAGADTLDGGAGADTLIGGKGDDTYVVDNIGDRVVEAANEGVDRIRTSLNTYTLVGSNVEHLTFTGTGAFVGIGNEAQNSISGGAGADTLDGGAGADSLAGGAGEDTYIVDNVGDRITEAANQGVDLVRASSSAYTLDSNVENLVFVGSGGFVGTGNAIANTITGGAGADTLSGGAGADVLRGGGGDDVIDGGADADVAVFTGSASDYALTISSDLSMVICDQRGGSPDGADTLKSVETLRFADRDVSLSDVYQSVIETAIANILRVTGPANTQLAINLAGRLTSGSIDISGVMDFIAAKADASTSVATLAYEFFTGKVPSAAGMDYLVSPNGPNANNINGAYYQAFNLENRYINFAVNLGKYGEGKDAFAAAYGAETLFDATRDAYSKIFGAAPSDAKLHALLDPTATLNGVTMSRADYFAYYGQDGANGIGAKAAMVGWLLAEAVKADVGTYALSNDLFLLDLIDGANFAVDIVGVYGKPEFAFQG